MEYDTPRWAQRVLWVLITLGLLMIPAIACAREPPQMTCNRAFGNKVKCEAKNVYPYTPLWFTTIGERLAEEERGLVVFLTMDTEWRTIHMVIAGDGANMILRAEARIVNGVPQFRGGNYEDAP